jgi:hypothetical protein
MNPIDPDSEDRDWIAQGWRYLLAQDLGNAARELDWLDRPALARSTISTPRLRRLFAGINAGKSYGGQVKPFNFMLVAFVPAIERPADEQRIVLVAPYEQNPRRWMELPWFNRWSGREYRITTEPSGGKVTPGVVCVKTYREVLDEYIAHAEAKSAAADARACRPGTRGLLHRRPVHMRTIAHIGKESNRLEDIEVGLVEDLAEVQSEYDDYYQRVFVPLVLPVLQKLGVRETARRSGHSLGAVSAALARRSKPRRSSLESYQSVAVAHAADRLAAADAIPAGGSVGVLARYRDRWGSRRLEL